jgi:hypothetical protein
MVQLADGLNLQNQDISVEINNHLLTLTKDTVDDSATVRTITLVTLTYLPASFMTVCTNATYILGRKNSFDDSNALYKGTFWNEPLQL